MNFSSSARSYYGVIKIIVGILFSSFGIGMFYCDPKNIFFWIWTPFVLFWTVMVLYQFAKGYVWTFDITKNAITIVSPFYPKVSLHFINTDIANICLIEGEMVSGTVKTNKGEKIQIPSSCLKDIKSIARSLNDVGIEVYLNKDQIT